jgi:hypothetical protein
VLEQVPARPRVDALPCGPCAQPSARHEGEIGVTVMAGNMTCCAKMLSSSASKNGRIGKLFGCPFR